MLMTHCDCLTKFIQQDTTNSKHKSLAQTIFTTPNMTLSLATSLFETYHPGEQPAESSAPSVNAILCTYCHKNGHKVKTCRNKIRVKSEKIPAAPQSTLQKIHHPANDSDFHAASARSRTTKLMNVLECQKFANAFA
jgi:hypothetical protein